MPVGADIAIFIINSHNADMAPCLEFLYVAPICPQKGGGQTIGVLPLPLVLTHSILAKKSVG